MPDDLLRGLGEPRPLPAHLRAALETALLVPDDELAGLLRSAQAPRVLPEHLREGLRGRLVRRSAAPAWLIGAAAAAVLVAGAVAALPSRTGDVPTTQALLPGPATPVPDAVPSLAPSTIAAPPAAGLNGPAAPAVTPHPSPRPAATAAVGSAGAGSGTAAGPPDAEPAAAGPQRGVTHIVPDEGPVAGGTRITLSGRDLSRAVAVLLDGRPGSDLVVESDTRITVVTPSAREPGRVTIEVRLSTEEVYLVPSAFSYLAVPAVTSVDPASGPATGGNVVVVSGRGFTERAAVSFGERRATEVEVVSDTELRVVAPAHLPGRVDLTVTTAGGTSNSADYVYGA